MMSDKLTAPAWLAGQVAIAILVVYVILRWLTVPVLDRLPAGVGHLLGLSVALLLLPEYLITVVCRRLIGQPAPLAYTYGDLVCSVAVSVYRTIVLLLSALRPAAALIDHRAALVAGIGVGIAVMIHAI
jgi:hypothetical protein